jgi:predicted DNA-binding transcriptional regulator AlpA
MPAEPPAFTDAVGIDARAVATLLGISVSHFFALQRTGRFGPQARRLGRAKRYDRDEVLTWFRAGCPARARWQAMQGGRQ